MTGNGEQFNEQLSALCDDELRAEEYPLVLRQLGRNAEARDRLGRHFLVRDCLHRNFSAAGAESLAARVSRALDDEPALARRPIRAPVAWLKPVAGVAVAASVALVSLLLMPGSETDAPAPLTASAGRMPAMTATPVSDSMDESLPSRDTRLAQAPVRSWDQLEPAAQQRLRGLLVNHSEQSSTGRLGGVLTYVRIAGHERSE